MRTTSEYVIEWVEGDKTATVTVPENSGRANKLAKYASEYPDEVEMKHSELFHIPTSWVSIRPPKKMNYTEEQRQALRERARTLRNKNTDKG